MSDCAVKWIKISTSMFDDEKIRFIEQLPDADTILIIWVKLLVLAGQKNAGGEVYFNDEIPYTEEMLAAIFHRKPNQVRLALETFVKLRMIEITSDRTIVISKWGKHQNLEGLDKIKYQTAERQKRFRRKQREQAFLARGAAAPQEHQLDVIGNVTPSDTSRPIALPSRAEKQNKTENQNKKKTKETPCRPPRGDGYEKTN